MIGIYTSNQLTATSSRQVNTEPPFLDWLVEKANGEPVWMYHLDANVASLMRLIGLSETEGKKLLESHKLSIPPYKLTYYPSKYFSIDKGFGYGHPFANFYNAGQYMDTHFEPKESVDTAIEKAKLASSIGEQVPKILHKLGLNTEKLASPVSALMNRIKELELPTIDDIPTEVGELSYRCIRGNWLEAFNCGSWSYSYDYDINGAYGSELVKLPNLRRGKWIHDKYPPVQSKFGFVSGTITTNANFHPFLLEGKDMNYSPVGNWETYLTGNELTFLNHYGLGKFEVEDAWWWVPEGKQRYPLKELIEWLHSQKQTGDSLESNIIRRCIAGIWGKFLEFRGDDFGAMFNPVYGSLVESNIRLKVTQTCIDNIITPLHIAVDGIITDRPLNLDTGNKMGQWRLSHQGKCIIVSSGVVGFEGKHGAEEFSLRYNWLEEQMRNNPNATELQMNKYSPITLAKALNTNSFDRLGEVEEVTRTIYLEPDSKRIWKDRPKHARDILSNQYQSSPIEASMIALSTPLKPSKL